MIASGGRSQFGLAGKIKDGNCRIRARVLSLLLGIRFSSELIVKSSSGVIRGLAALLACSTCLSAESAEYCLRPNKRDGTQADSVVCCSTPTGWQGWKDDPRGRESMKNLDAYSRTWLGKMVVFHQPDCMKGPECPYLSLKTTGRDSRGQLDVEAGLRNFLNEFEQPQGPRRPPCVVVSRFGSFHTDNSGDPTIWRIRCPSGKQLFVTLLALRDVLVTIDLGSPDIEDIVPKLDSLKELAQSARITDASLALPDIIEIDARLSDGAIRRQLLQLTPLGTTLRERVYRLLQRPRLPDDLHRDNGDLWTQIGRYSSPASRQRVQVKEYRLPTGEKIRQHISDPPTLPPATTVRAFWKFDKGGKLRDIEIRREAIEIKPQ
jgi:hypothetical protein